MVTGVQRRLQYVGPSRSSGCVEASQHKVSLLPASARRTIDTQSRGDVRRRRVGVCPDLESHAVRPGRVTCPSLSRSDVPSSRSRPAAVDSHPSRLWACRPPPVSREKSPHERNNHGYCMASPAMGH